MAVRGKGISKEWKTYRTRFLIRAVQLTEDKAFMDALGREHSGRKGDYLVESQEGVRSIVPQRVFEDVYVAIARESEPKPGSKAKGQGKVKSTVRPAVRPAVKPALKSALKPAVKPIGKKPAQPASVRRLVVGRVG